MHANDVVDESKDLAMAIKSLDVTLRQHSDTLLLSDKRFLDKIQNKDCLKEAEMWLKDSRICSKKTVGDYSPKKIDGKYQLPAIKGRSVDQLERSEEKSKTRHILSSSISSTSKPARIEDIKRNQKVLIVFFVLFIYDKSNNNDS